MASAAPSDHADSECIIGLALKCPQFECIFRTNIHTHISDLYYIDWVLRAIGINFEWTERKNFKLRETNYNSHNIHVVKKIKKLFQINVT